MVLKFVQLCTQVEDISILRYFKLCSQVKASKVFLLLSKTTFYNLKQLQICFLGKAISAPTLSFDYLLLVFEFFILFLFNKDLNFNKDLAL